METESDLSNPVAARFERRGFVIQSEFKCNGKRVDLVAKSSSGPVVCVELKLRDWRRAALQAARHLTWADFCYIAMPASKRDLLIRERHILQELGIGAYTVDGTTGSVKLLISASRSRMIIAETRTMAEHLLCEALA